MDVLVPVTHLGRRGQQAHRPRGLGYSLHRRPAADPPQLVVRSGETFADGDGDDEVNHRAFIFESPDGATGGRSSALACGNQAVIVTFDQNRESTLWVVGVPEP